MSFTRQSSLFLVAAVLLTGSLPAFGRDHTIFVTVNANSGPWIYGNGSVNAGYPYGSFDQQPPVVIDSSSGFLFTPGSRFIITYVSGLVACGYNFTPFDANGDPSDPLDNQTEPWGTAPSYYMNPATYPINLGELVATFANSHGQIVGRPFAIGNGPFAVRAPFGATALQLGINDNLYGDNSGSFVVKILGPLALRSTNE